MGIDSIDNGRGEMLRLKPEAGVHPQHESRRLSRRLFAALARRRVGRLRPPLRRPLQRGGRADTRDSRPDDLAPAQEQGSFAKAARGDERVEFARNVIRERARFKAFGAHGDAHWTCGDAALLAGARLRPLSIALMIKPRARSTKPGAALLAWYDVHRRELPWRARAGEAPDPYRVWLSEIMLQQTTVATVKERYAAFLSRWPAIDDLARAPLDDVLAQWAGLGYYARARNLHACARAVVEGHQRRFPRDEAALRRLPGIGPYTAAAIAAIAFDQHCVAVDGNVERVVARLHAMETPPRKIAPQIREKAAALMSSARPGDSVQALMELGALVCAPQTPDCPACPLSSFCAARRLGAQSDYPARALKRPKPRRRGAIFILRRGDEALLLRRPPRGLFGGMNAFPSTPLTQDIAAAEFSGFAPCAARWRALEEPVTHIFTHFALEATVFVAHTRAKAAPSDCRWAARANLGKEGLPTLMRKAAARAGLIDA